VRARQLRQEQTAAEAKLWYYLRDRRLDGFKFRRQHAIGRFVVDFCCPERRLIVEVDGPAHDQQAERDQARTEALQAAGYRVIRYTNDAVDQRIDSVLADLRRALTSDDSNASSPSPAAAGDKRSAEGGLGGG
jgi:5-methyltetrahydrofolate--homocysteine methyltransferase